MSPSPLSPSRSSGHKSRKKGNRTRSLSSVSGNEQSNGNVNAQVGEGTSLSVALPMQPTHLPKDIPLPPSPTGTSTSIPPVGEPSPDQGANKKQETKHDQLAKVSQALALSGLRVRTEFPLPRTVPRVEMTRYNGSGSRLNVPDGRDYTIWLVNSTGIGSRIIKKISILSWCL